MSLRILEQLVGAFLVLFILTDVFLTVLYARIGTGLISDHIAKWTWAGFRHSSTIAGQRRGTVLSFCGPTILVLILFVWSIGLTCGMALIIHPKLGSSLVVKGETTPTDFVSAIYVAGTSISTVGENNFVPTTGGMRLFFFWNSLVGISVLTLTLTYLLQVYSALRDRNTLGLKLHVLSRETGDATELLAGLGPDGDFHPGYTILVEVAAELTALKEAHHFYPVLFYFRFRQPFYSVSHIARLVLDLVTLSWTAIDQQEYRWLAKSAAVSQLNDSALLIMKILEEAFVTGGPPAPHEGVEQARAKPAWDAHFHASLRRLRAAGIETVEDAKKGAQRYFEIRSQWEPFVHKLGSSGAFDPYETDPSTALPSRDDIRAKQETHSGF
jgi:hypothetical protein